MEAGHASPAFFSLTHLLLSNLLSILIMFVFVFFLNQAGNKVFYSNSVLDKNLARFELLCPCIVI